MNLGLILGLRLLQNIFLCSYFALPNIFQKKLNSLFFFFFTFSGIIIQHRKGLVVVGVCAEFGVGILYAMCYSSMSRLLKHCLR